MSDEAQVVVGFAAQAVDAAGGGLDWYHRLVPHPEAVFLMRVGQVGLPAVGVMPNDLLIVDRSRDALPGRVAVVVSDGALALMVIPAASGEESLEVWGVVTASVTEHPGQSRAL